MNIAKHITIAIAILLSCTVTGQNKQEVSVYGGGGSSTLKYNTSIGKQKNGNGGLFGIDYAYFFTKHLGISSGIEIALYNSQLSFDEFSDKYMIQDYNKDWFEFRTTVTDYEEKQNTTYLNIPFLLRMQTGGKNKLYAAVGYKIGIPLGINNNTISSTIRNTGYYKNEDYEYTTQEFMGFGTFKDRPVNNDISIQPAFFLSAELGMKWVLKESLYLYTGAYIDYGVNNVYENKTYKPVIEYNVNSPRDFIVNSPLAAQYTIDKRQDKFVKKITPMAVGVKVRLAFDVGKQLLK